MIYDLKMKSLNINLFYQDNSDILVPKIIGN